MVKKIKKYHKSFVNKVSIVTINYDSLEELKKTIESVDNQKIKPYRHIIVSKKLKLHQVQIFKRKYRKFVLGKDNSLYNAMNIGKKYCINQSLIFLNSGDVFFNKKSLNLLYENYATLKKNNVIVFKTVLMDKYKYFHPKKNFFERKNYLPHSSFIFFNSKLNSKINFDEKMIITADGKWMKQIIQNSNRLIKINKNLVIQNLDGQSSVPSLKTVYYRLKENINSGVKEIIKLVIKSLLSDRLYFRLIFFNKYL